MEEDLRTYVLGQSPVSALIGSRFQWGERPQASSLPSAVATVVSALRSYSMAGDNDLNQTRVQIDIYGDTYSSTKGAARAIDAALRSHRGTTGNTAFRGVFKDGERDEREAGSNEADRFFRVSLDYIVHHKST